MFLRFIARTTTNKIIEFAGDNLIMRNTKHNINLVLVLDLKISLRRAKHKKAMERIRSEGVCFET